MVMKTGLVLGKFMPLHKGHMALIDFSLQHCDQLIVLLCSSEKEKIPGAIRKEWLRETYKNNDRIRVEHVEYNEDELPNTSVSSHAVSEKWAAFIGKTFPEVNIFFSSEPYGEYVANFLHIDHICFDQERNTVRVAASGILLDPYNTWDLIASAARSYFVRKIGILGSESTGKSTLAEKLALHYNTAFVPEMAREIIEKTEDVVIDDLFKIAELHAKTINEKLPQANRLLFIDTDVNITKSYARFLFNQYIYTPDWINEANKFDTIIYLETDCPYVQDGTRLSQNERNKLDKSHKQQLKDAGITYTSIGGNWDERFEKSKWLIDTFYVNR